MYDRHDDALLWFVPAACLFLAIFWALPVWLGLRIAQRKRYSKWWMLFGLYPLTAWIMLLILAVLPARRRCPDCRALIARSHERCPRCHASLVYQRRGFTALEVPLTSSPEVDENIDAQASPSDREDDTGVRPSPSPRQQRRRIERPTSVSAALVALWVSLVAIPVVLTTINLVRILTDPASSSTIIRMEQLKEAYPEALRDLDTEAVARLWPIQLAFAAAIIGLSVLLISLLSKARDWARYVLLVISICGVPWALLTVWRNMQTDPLGAILAVTQVVILIVATVLLFVTTANDWFWYDSKHWQQ